MAAAVWLFLAAYRWNPGGRRCNYGGGGLAQLPDSLEKMAYVHKPFFSHGHEPFSQYDKPFPQRVPFLGKLPKSPGSSGGKTGG